MSRVSALLSGVVVCAVLVIAARLLDEYAAVPAMLGVLLLGVAVRAVGNPRFHVVEHGVAFSARTLLRIGVALLGARVVLDDLVDLGPAAIAVVLASVAATLGGGIWLARRAGLSGDLARISATSVAICGASAALAASAIMPSRAGLVRDTALVIVIVSLLSTAVMIGYPLLVQALGFDANATAVILGAAIHDVAQVVGAGFAVSPDVGVKAVTVKMLRVACLVPAVLWLAYRVACHATERQHARIGLPWFLWTFVILAAVSSLGFLPPSLRELTTWASSILLLMAVGAIGLQTDLQSLRQAPLALVRTIIVQSAFQFGLVVGAVTLLNKL
ncbi:MAG: putative sulfate exporter family transporter [Pseudomonadota bacterium]